jgi:biotin transport system substrate-specific component
MSESKFAVHSKTIAAALPKPRSLTALDEIGLAVTASLFVALCAHISIPLPFTPVPLTLQNFAVLAVGLCLGSRRGLAALALYLLEGALGAPVFNPAGLGGVAQLLGPTGGYLFAYPAVAYLAGLWAERRGRNFSWLAGGAAIAELLLFAGGVSWLMLLTGASLAKAAAFGLYPFVPAEVLKESAAAAIAA